MYEDVLYYYYKEMCVNSILKHRRKPIFLVLLSILKEYNSITQIFLPIPWCNKKKKKKTFVRTPETSLWQNTDELRE